MLCTRIAKVHAYCFGGREFESVVRDPTLYVFTQSCKSLSAYGRVFTHMHGAKLSTNNEQSSEPFRTKSSERRPKKNKIKGEMGQGCNIEKSNTVTVSLCI